jgi:hypothetical protein
LSIFIRSFKIFNFFEILSPYNFKKIEYFVRSDENAQDESTTESVLLEYLNLEKHNSNDRIILTQATSPFTLPEDFDKALIKMNQDNLDSIFSCVEFKRFLWDKNSKPINYDFKLRPRRQDFDGVLLENGAFYISTIEKIIKSKNRISGQIGNYIMPEFSNVEIDEIDACPVQIQGPKSKALMNDLIGDQVDLDNMPFYGLANAKVGGRSCVISQSGFSGEAGYEIYLRNATLYAEDMWNAVLKAGKKHKLMVIAPAHHRRIQAGILSWGQDMDHEHNPFQCNLGYQVSLSGKGEWNKQSDYIGKEALEKMKKQIKNGEKPYKLQLVGMELGGKPIEDYANDFYLISHSKGGKPVGYITSPWYHPEKKTNIAIRYYLNSLRMEHIR